MLHDVSLFPLTTDQYFLLGISKRANLSTIRSITEFSQYNNALLINETGGTYLNFEKNKALESIMNTLKNEINDFFPEEYKDVAFMSLYNRIRGTFNPSKKQMYMYSTSSKNGSAYIYCLDISSFIGQKNCFGFNCIKRYNEIVQYSSYSVHLNFIL